jgi:hypothetical protein
MENPVEMLISAIQSSQASALLTTSKGYNYFSTNTSNIGQLILTCLILSPGLLYNLAKGATFYPVRPK